MAGRSSLWAVGLSAWIGLLCLGSFCFVGAGCGAGLSEVSAELADPDNDFDARGMLRLYASTSTELLRRREESLEELDRRVVSLSGEEQRQARLDLAVLYLHAAAEAEPEGARASRGEAERLVREAAEGSRDRATNARIEFLRLWIEWESGDPGTDARVRRYLSHYGDGEGSLVALAHLIKGELEMDGHRYLRASRAFRVVLDQEDHPLHGYALYRTARCWAALGEVSLAEDALGEVERLGCPGDASPLNLTLSARAGQQLGHRPLPEMSWGERGEVCDGGLEGQLTP